MNFNSAKTLTIPEAHAYEESGFGTPLAAQTGTVWETLIHKNP